MNLWDNKEYGAWCACLLFIASCSVLASSSLCPLCELDRTERETETERERDQGYQTLIKLSAAATELTYAHLFSSSLSSLLFQSQRSARFLRKRNCSPKIFHPHPPRDLFPRGKRGGRGRVREEKPVGSLVSSTRIENKSPPHQCFRISLH